MVFQNLPLSITRRLAGLEKNNSQVVRVGAPALSRDKVMDLPAQNQPPMHLIEFPIAIGSEILGQVNPLQQLLAQLPSEASQKISHDLTEALIAAGFFSYSNDGWQQALRGDLDESALRRYDTPQKSKFTCEQITDLHENVRVYSTHCTAALRILTRICTNDISNALALLPEYAALPEQVREWAVQGVCRPILDGLARSGKKNDTFVAALGEEIKLDATREHELRSLPLDKNSKPQRG